MQKRARRSTRLVPILAAATALAGVACRAAGAGSDGDAAAAAGSSPASTPAVPSAGAREGGLRVAPSPAQGAVDSIVKSALERARGEGRTLVVYVGATWCEPCQHFHHAAERGDLDADFPRLTLLEFDLDRDRDRLAAARYASKYIPLFALPSPDGTASGKQIEGGIKGDGAVAFIAPRLKAMLAE